MPRLLLSPYAERSSPPAPARRRAATALAALVSLLLAEPALAQRAEAKISFEDRVLRIDYGAVRLGKHGLSEMAEGGEWRLGSGNATKLETTAPLVVGDEVVPPGGYKLALRRGRGTEFSLEVARAGFALSEKHGSVLLPLEYAEEEKPAQKLAISLSALSDPRRGPPNLVLFRAAYGIHRVTAASVLPGTETAKAKGFDVAVFALDSDLVARRSRAGRNTPVASLSRKQRRRGEPERWNIVLGRDSVLVRPAPEAPTENFGFGKIPDDEVDPDEAALVREGTASRAPAQSERPRLSLESAKPSEDGGVVLVLGCGKDAVTLELPDPMKKSAETRRGE